MYEVAFQLTLYYMCYSSLVPATNCAGSPLAECLERRLVLQVLVQHSQQIAYHTLVILCTSSFLHQLLLLKIYCYRVYSPRPFHSRSYHIYVLWLFYIIILRLFFYTAVCHALLQLLVSAPLLSWTGRDMGRGPSSGSHFDNHSSVARLCHLWSSRKITWLQIWVWRYECTVSFWENGYVAYLVWTPSLHLICLYMYIKLQKFPPIQYYVCKHKCNIIVTSS